MNQYSNKYTEEDYKNRCDILNDEYIGFEKNHKGDTLIKYICRKHIEKGIQITDWGHFRIQKNSCRYCSGRARTTAEAQEMVLNPNIELISEYTGTEKPIKCLCHKCGNVWITNRPLDLFKREGGCPVCAKESRGNKRRKTTDDFVKDMNKVNPNIEVLGEYHGAHKLIKCKCIVDNYTWSSYPSNLLNGSAGCPICNMSLGEKAIIKFMNDHKITYTKQKTFPECKDSGLLRFDVFDEDNNIAIEFQGEQHYFPIDFAGRGDDYASEQYEKLKIRDKIKEEYCKNNNIMLVQIPYWERGNEGDFLINNIKVYKEKYAA